MKFVYWITNSVYEGTVVVYCSVREEKPSTKSLASLYLNNFIIGF